MYSFSGNVRYSELDEEADLSIYSMLNYLQDCALFQSEHLGVGVAHAQEVRRRWLMAAWEVEILRRPAFTEHITVSTWATNFKGLFAHRNFTIVDDAAEELVRADSLWFMYDDATGRPIRALPEDTEPYHEDLEQDSPIDMPPIQRRIPVEGPGEAMTPLLVTQAHIDTNHHVNNAQYVNMALAYVPEGEPIRWLDVQYCTAARLGDMIYPSVHTIEGGAVIDLADADGNSYAVVRVRK